MMLKLQGSCRQLSDLNQSSKGHRKNPACPPTLGEPFIVKPVRGTSIRTCFGCQGSLRNVDLCVAHRQAYFFYNRQQKTFVKCFRNKHFHLEMNCIRAGNNPSYEDT